MYKYLSQRDNIIPIAVLRGTFPHMKIGPKGNKMPYVFTNPDKDTELFTCDRLFVLSQKPLTTTKLKTLLEASKDIRTYEESQRNIVKVNNIYNNNYDNTFNNAYKLIWYMNYII